MSSHELHKFMRKASESIAADYARIAARVREDPGTAGDQGEANWEQLFAGWLPAGYHVMTKGRILSTSGVASPQVDVVILKQSYPRGLLRDKLYLADGVLAAFECKLTLRPEHIRQAFRTCRIIKAMVNTDNENTTAYRQLHAPIIYGMVAHSHSTKKRKAGPVNAIESNIVRYDRELCEHPRFMLDSICIADLAAWQAVKYARYPALTNNGAFVPMSVYRRRASSYPFLTENLQENDPVCTPLGGLISDLLVRLAWEDPGLRPIANYFTRASIGGAAGHGIARQWPVSIFSAAAQRRIAHTELSAGWPTSWDEWGWEYS